MEMIPILYDITAKYVEKKTVNEILKKDIVERGRIYVGIERTGFREGMCPQPSQ